MLSWIRLLVIMLHSIALASNSSQSGVVDDLIYPPVRQHQPPHPSKMAHKRVNSHLDTPLKNKIRGAVIMADALGAKWSYNSVAETLNKVRAESEAVVTASKVSYPQIAQSENGTFVGVEGQ